MLRHQHLIVTLGSSAVLLLPHTTLGQAANQPAAPTSAATSSPVDAKLESDGSAGVPETKVDTPTALAAEPPEPSALAADPPKPSASDDRAKLTEALERIEELERRFNEQQSAEDGAASEERKLSGWGFFDITFGKALLDHSQAAYGGYVPRYSSFMTNGVNLYLKSEMTKTLSAMVETRLTYTPVGVNYSKPVDVYMDGVFVQSQGVAERGGSVSKNPYSYFMYRQHGLFIERAHFDWKPRDWFGVRVGRYLTPFGIWNEDHGSPVTLGVDMPNLINYALVPTHQLGLQVYGVQPLAENLNLEYAITASNGRGPIDEYKDLDDNKALGLRLKATYSADNLFLRLGGYAYYGKYTDSYDYLRLAMTPALTLDRSQSAPFGAGAKTTEAYRETIGTLDATVQLYGFRLMAELAERRVMFDVAPTMDPVRSTINGTPYGTQIFAGSYVGVAYYGMLGYEFELGESLGNMKVTPYAGADHLSPDKTQPVMVMNQYRFGVNLKPSPYLTGKLEAVRVVPRATELGSEMWVLVAQSAVSF